jgi:murein L,D-transpeptidase YcbB/YkuD
MKRKKWMIALLGALLLLSGCVEVTSRSGVGGWSSAQKQEFLQILANDRYLSICNQEGLYQEVKQTRDSQKMVQMLVAYTNNLANSCIDLKGFESIQKKRRANGFETSYTTYLQEVNTQHMMAQLRAGVSIASILAPYIPQNEQFEKLAHAYRSFAQARTLSPQKLYKLRQNIERVKIMNDDLGHDYILVNVPEFMVRVKAGDQTTLSFKIVVGQTNLQTPIFAERLKHVILNPQWSVPDSIARNEIIPAILKNPNYLKANRLVIRKTYDLNSEKLNPSKETLQAYRGGKGVVPFKFIEVPSAYNALGRVKFIFPNHHSVYMHDTQMKKLFAKPVRCFSHGCVRLEKPQSLLSYVTMHYSDTTLDQVNQWYKSMKTHYLRLNKRVMVHTAYHTAYIREDGKLVMFDDVYLFDKYQRLNFTP